MKTKTKKIINQLKGSAPEIFQGRNILFAYLHGSVASDQFHRFSDLDIGVYTQHLSPHENRKLELDLGLIIDEKLRDAPESDVRTMNILPIAITGKIVTEGFLIYCENEKQRIEYETRIRMEYFDFLPVIRSYQHTYLTQTQIIE